MRPSVSSVTSRETQQETNDEQCFELLCEVVSALLSSAQVAAAQLPIDVAKLLGSVMAHLRSVSPTSWSQYLGSLVHFLIFEWLLVGPHQLLNGEKSQLTHDLSNLLHQVLTLPSSAIGTKIFTALSASSDSQVLPPLASLVVFLAEHTPDPLDSEGDDEEAGEGSSKGNDSENGNDNSNCHAEEANEVPGPAVVASESKDELTDVGELEAIIRNGAAHQREDLEEIRYLVKTKALLINTLIHSVLPWRNNKTRTLQDYHDDQRAYQLMAPYFKATMTGYQLDLAVPGAIGIGEGLWGAIESQQEIVSLFGSTTCLDFIVVAIYCLLACIPITFEFDHHHATASPSDSGCMHCGNLRLTHQTSGPVLGIDAILNYLYATFYLPPSFDPAAIGCPPSATHTRGTTGDGTWSPLAAIFMPIVNSTHEFVGAALSSASYAYAHRTYHPYLPSPADAQLAFRRFDSELRQLLVTEGFDNESADAVASSSTGRLPQQKASASTSSTSTSTAGHSPSASESSFSAQLQNNGLKPGVSEPPVLFDIYLLLLVHFVPLLFDFSLDSTTKKFLKARYPSIAPFELILRDFRIFLAFNRLNQLGSRLFNVRFQALVKAKPEDFASSLVAALTTANSQIPSQHGPLELLFSRQTHLDGAVHRLYLFYLPMWKWPQVMVAVAVSPFSPWNEGMPSTADFSTLMSFRMLDMPQSTFRTTETNWQKWFKGAYPHSTLVDWLSQRYLFRNTSYSDVYALLTDGARLSTGTKSRCDVTPKEGTAFSYLDGALTGTVVYANPAELQLVQRWRVESFPSFSSAMLGVAFRSGDIDGKITSQIRFDLDHRMGTPTLGCSHAPATEPFEHNQDAILPWVQVHVLLSLVPRDQFKDATKLWSTKFFSKLNCIQCVSYETAAVHPTAPTTDLFERLLKKTAPSRSAVGVGSAWSLPGSGSTGTTLKLNPPTQLVRTLQVPGDFETNVEITLSAQPVGKGSVMHIKHDFVPRDLFPNITDSWTPLFDSLKAQSTDSSIKYHGASISNCTNYAALSYFTSTSFLHRITRATCRVAQEDDGPLVYLWTEFLKLRIRRVPYKIDTKDCVERLLFWRIESWPKDFYVITNLYINSIPSAFFKPPNGVRLSMAHSNLLLKNKKQSLEFFDALIKELEKNASLDGDVLKTALLNAGY